MRSSPAVATGGTVYFGADRFYAVHPDGSRKWAADLGAEIRSSPAIGADGLVYVGTDGGRLMALGDIGTSASVLFDLDLGATVRSSPAIVAGSLLLVGSDAARLVALQRSPATLDECREAAPVFGPGCECVCEHCLAELNRCGAEPGCSAMLGCVLEVRCRGLDCYTPNLCQDILDEHGGPFGPLSFMLEQVETCTDLNCPTCLAP